MKKEKNDTQMLALISTQLSKNFKKKLIDDGLSYKEWLIQRIEEYLKEDIKK